MLRRPTDCPFYQSGEGMLKRNDIILIGVIVLLGLTAFFVMKMTRSDGSQVLVTIDGKKYQSFELNKDMKFTIHLENKEENTFEIKDGYVKMVDATCPDKLCVQHSGIHYNHETIVCLPHKVVLQIVGGEEDDVDFKVK